MNITDIDWDKIDLPWVHSDLVHTPPYPGREEETPAPDLLATMFNGQRALYEKYMEIEARNGCVVVDPEDFGNLDSRDVQMRIKDLMERTIEELMEAANCLKNKPWKNSFVPTDVTHFDEEIGDAIHFFIELLILIGWDADKTFKIYFLKNAVNQFRQRSNY